MNAQTIFRQPNLCDDKNDQSSNAQYLWKIFMCCKTLSIVQCSQVSTLSIVQREWKKIIHRWLVLNQKFKIRLPSSQY